MTKDSLAVAIEALSWMAYSNLGERSALAKAAEELKVTRPDELRQAHRLIMETTRYQNRLDYIIGQHLEGRATEQIPHGVMSFLRIITYMRHVEDASMKEIGRQVELARQILGWKELRSYEETMAVLVSKVPGQYTSEDTEYERLAVQTCHPEWFVREPIRIFGRSFALRMLSRNQQAVPTYVRLNALKERSGAEEVIRKAGGSPIDRVQGVFRLETGAATLIQSGDWASGVFVIQDFASIVAGLVASPNSGFTVVDVCAAPGNKTTHLAAQMNNEGAIYSLELSAKRLRQWKKEIRRTGVTIANPILSSSQRIPLRTDADVVVVDPPCSNTGVFARSPELKWKATPGRVREASLTQFSILQAASNFVREKGNLIYCTCSVLPDENENVIDLFLRLNQNFRLVHQSPFLGLPGLKGFELCQRFYTHIHDCNGYFIAKMERAD